MTEATGTGVTVIDALPLLPSLVASMLAVPALTAVTRPDSETVAICGALEVHVTARPLNRLLRASFRVTESCSVAPATRVADPGFTLTSATGAGVTVNVALPPGTTGSFYLLVVADGGQHVAEGNESNNVAARRLVDGVATVVAQLPPYEHARRMAGSASLSPLSRR